MNKKPLYIVKTAQLIGKDSDYPCFSVLNWRPEGAVGPTTSGRVLWIPDTGLDIAMWCYETNPRAVYLKPNDPVHTDSCMEAFINIFPDMENKGYINFEMNHNGASHCSFGTCRGDRKYVLDLGLPHPSVDITDFEDENGKGWRAHGVLSRRLIEILYGRPAELASDHLMKGNFYKCGDLTESPHWGSWSAVERVDFHTPEFFGDLRLE